MMNADQEDFQLYSSGVFTASCGTNLNHEVLAVGYDTYTDGTDYYKVKNTFCLLVVPVWHAKWTSVIPSAVIKNVCKPRI
jgi:hypothetical protein